MGWLDSGTACWAFNQQLHGLWWTGSTDAGRLQAVQQQRLHALLAHARHHSALYARLVRALPHAQTLRLERWPRVTRAQLMRHFDDWVTDPQIRLHELKAFVADRQRIGEPYLGRYVVWTSSGSTGEPGLYVQDPRAMAVYDALAAARWQAPDTISPLLALGSGQRVTLVTATGGHFAGIVSWARMRRLYPWLAGGAQALSIQRPMREVVDRLNAQPPCVLAAYPTTLLLLAQAREAGHLHVKPRVACSGGETLRAPERQRIATALGCPVVDAYGASECLHIAFECAHGTLHLNSDWVLLEPVDAQGRPVAVGQASTSVLLTNLANHVQPLIRYDLGDSITLLERCACGSGLPALRVAGRRDDILTLPSTAGTPVSLPPLALASAVEEGAGVHRFQVLQTGRRALAVRFVAPKGRSRTQTWNGLRRCLLGYLQTQGVAGVQLSADPQPPRPDPVTGKLRLVVGARAALRG